MLKDIWSLTLAVIFERHDGQVNYIDWEEKNSEKESESRDFVALKTLMMQIDWQHNFVWEVDHWSMQEWSHDMRSLLMISSFLSKVDSAQTLA